MALVSVEAVLGAVGNRTYRMEHLPYGAPTVWSTYRMEHLPYGAPTVWSTYRMECDRIPIEILPP